MPRLVEEDLDDEDLDDVEDDEDDEACFCVFSIVSSRVCHLRCLVASPQ